MRLRAGVVDLGNVLENLIVRHGTGEMIIEQCHSQSAKLKLRVCP